MLSMTKNIGMSARTRSKNPILMEAMDFKRGKIVYPVGVGRCYSLYKFTRSHKPILFDGLKYTIRRRYWVSATQTRNYMLNDSLIDWISMTPNRSDIRRKNNRTRRNKCAGSKTFINYILKKGCDFEREVVRYINDYVYPVKFVSNTITDESIKRTKELMDEGYPIIHSAPVVNSRNKTRGIIDLLVRRDF